MCHNFAIFMMCHKFGMVSSNRKIMLGVKRDDFPRFSSMVRMKKERKVWISNMVY